MMTLEEIWKPLYCVSRTFENWIVPNKEDKYFRATGVIVNINPDYLNGALKGTGVNVVNEINNYVYFFGQIPESFLGRAVDVEQRIIEEEGEYSYTVEQRILPMESLKQYENKTFPCSDFPKKAACNMMLCAIGRFPKKAVSLTIRERLQNFLCRGRVGL